MRLNKKMIGKSITVTANGKTGFKKISGRLVSYRANEIDIAISGRVDTFERSEGWKIESVK